jgi:hypothetical protein
MKTTKEILIRPGVRLRYAASEIDDLRLALIALIILLVG